MTESLTERDQFVMLVRGAATERAMRLRDQLDQNLATRIINALAEATKKG